MAPLLVRLALQSCTLRLIQGYSIGITGQSRRTLYRVLRRESQLEKSDLGRIDSQTLVQAFGLFWRSDHLVQVGNNTCLRARTLVQRNAWFSLRQWYPLLDGCLPSRAMLPKRRSCSVCPTSFAATNYRQRITLYTFATWCALLLTLHWCTFMESLCI